MLGASSHLAKSDYLLYLPSSGPTMPEVSEDSKISASVWAEGSNTFSELTWDLSADPEYPLHINKLL